MKSLGGFTVIRGKGDDGFQVVINGIVETELEKLHVKELQKKDEEIEALKNELSRVTRWLMIYKRRYHSLMEEKLAAIIRQEEWK